MKKIKEVIRLGTTTNLSIRQIARSLQLSRPVVSKYLACFKRSGLSFDEIKQMQDDFVYELFFNNPDKKVDNDSRYSFLSSQFEYYSKELKKQHVTLHRLWEEYIAENPNGYSRSRFCAIIKKWISASELTMHIEHKAGDKAFVDFAGKKLYLTDWDSGKKIPVETIIAILPSSQYTFACVTHSQKTRDWIKATEEALWYFGGVPTAITPDCYKSAVKKYDRYDPEINPQYLQFANHYKTIILPARPAHPKDKALVENTVKIVYQWIYASLRNQEFYSIGELNRAILTELEKYNSKKMQSNRQSRLEIFHNTEKDILKPLPIGLYEYKECAKATIQSNYHIYLSKVKKYFSVPYRYYSKSIQTGKNIKAEVYYNCDIVEIYFSNERIAVHSANNKNRYVTNPAHMPEAHAKYG